MFVRAPRIGKAKDGRVQVERWGKIGNVIMRTGDRFVLGAEVPGSLLVLVPMGHGRPMLGRRTKGRLLAEPSLVPASPLRWKVLGSILALERDLERHVMDLGRWFASVRLDTAKSDAESCRKDFLGGWMEASEVDALTLKAVLAPERFGFGVACAVGSEPNQVAELLDSTPMGCIRIAMDSSACESDRKIIPGPWPVSRESRDVAPETKALREGGVQLRLFEDSSLMHAC